MPKPVYALYNKQCCPIPIDKPMTVAGTPKNIDELLSTGEYVMQPKKNGIFVQVVCINASEIHIFTRNLDKETGFFYDCASQFPHIRHWAQGLTPYTIIQGELYIPGKRPNYVSNVSKMEKWKAIHHQAEKCPRARLYIFDITMLGWRDMKNFPYEDRYRILSEIYASQRKERGTIELAETYTITATFMEEAKKLMDAGEEGVVFKRKKMRYRPGRYGYDKWDMFKFKRAYDGIDCFISKIFREARTHIPEELDGKYTDEEGNIVSRVETLGAVSGVELSVMDNEGNIIPVVNLCTSPKFTLPLELAQKIYDDPEGYMGQVMSIRANVNPKAAPASLLPRKEGVFTDNLLQNPVVTRLRYDKMATDCTMEGVLDILYGGKVPFPDPKGRLSGKYQKDS